MEHHFFPFSFPTFGVRGGVPPYTWKKDEDENIEKVNKHELCLYETKIEQRGPDYDMLHFFMTTS